MKMNEEVFPSLLLALIMAKENGSEIVICDEKKQLLTIRWIVSRKQYAAENEGMTGYLGDNASVIADELINASQKHNYRMRVFIKYK